MAAECVEDGHTAGGPGSDDELDEPKPFLRVNTVTVKGLGLVHNFVPVCEEDSGQRCVVDGFPATNTMRFMGPYTAPDTGEVQRCVVQIENPDGEDTVLMERGLLVRMVRVKLAHDETILSGTLFKRGGSVKTWKKRWGSLDGDGYFRYYVDSSQKRLKGMIDIRRDCSAIEDDADDAAWPATSQAECRICIRTEVRTYFICVDTTEDARAWRSALQRVSRQLHRQHIASDPENATAAAAATDTAGVKKGLFPETTAINPDLRLSTASSTISDVETEDVVYMPRRIRKHMLRPALTNNQQICKSSGKKIGMRVKHLICTQCRKRYHPAHVPKAHADCIPPAFGSQGAGKRIAPPLGTNIAAAVMHSSDSGKVPGLVEDLISIIDSRGIVEGVYRVPGDKRGTRDLIQRYFEDPRRKRLGIYTIDSIHTCASALKQFLRELDEPLISFDTYAQFIKAVKQDGPEAKARGVVEALSTLPLYNFYTLKELVEHLQRVAARVDVTRMKFSNLAAVFAPTLLASPDGDDVGLRDVMAQMVVVDVILKLDSEAWYQAQDAVESARRIQNPSPVPERSGTSGSGGGAGSPSVKRQSQIQDSPVGSPKASEDVLQVDVVEASDSHLVPGQLSSRSNPLYRSSNLELHEEEEINEILGEVSGGFQEEEIFGFNDVDIVEGAADGALLEGFEQFSLDASEQATVTLVTGRRARAGERRSAGLLGVDGE